MTKYAIMILLLSTVTAFGQPAPSSTRALDVMLHACVEREVMATIQAFTLHDQAAQVQTPPPASVAPSPVKKP